MSSYKDKLEKLCENNKRLKVDQVQKTIELHPFFDGQSMSVRFISSPTSSFRLSSMELSQSFLKNYSDKGFQYAIDLLNSILDIKEINFKLIAIICGVELKDEIVINDKLSLKPFTELTKAGGIKYLMNEINSARENPYPIMGVSPYKLDDHKFPYLKRSALVYQYGEYDTNRKHTFYSTSERSNLDLYLEEIINFLPVIIPECNTFIELIDLVPEHQGLNQLHSGFGMSIKYSPIIPTEQSTTTISSESFDLPLLLNFMALEGSLKDKLNLALKHYVESLWVLDSDRQVLGCAIALECILLNRNSKYKTRTLSNKAASLLATSKSRKKYYSNLFTGFYNLRSEIVHAGKANYSRKITLNGSRVISGGDSLREIKSLIPLIIKALINRDQSQS
ncbi:MULTISPECIES: HEPN domain-containing protein [Pseudoalteromonas]|uniref:HEPN domain-containing protein n=1 Tax=Pseudoalteromonas TaxID=53246 RepID=UPI00057AFCF3|nr:MULTISPECIES: HEPN domain-containing protein [Pseudoalteromonas]ATG58216.1 hypothetical protein CPA52_08155 [Pseudoalteromonas marina]